jgi:ATP-dependent Lon protease
LYSRPFFADKLSLIAVDLGTVPPELMGSFQIIFYQSAEDAVFKALGVE